MRNGTDPRCLYVANIVLDLAAGYGRKVLGQAAGFCDSGVPTDVLCLSSIRRVELRRADGRREAVGRARIPALYRFYLLGTAFRLLRRERYEIVYFRYPRADAAYFALLLWLRFGGSRPRVYSEIPTYPYDPEERGFVSLGTALWRLQDRSFRHFCKFLIDRFVVVSHGGRVFGRPALRIENGVDPAAVSLRPPVRDGGPLVGVAVAHVKPWHGYDRILRGMAAAQVAGAATGRLVVISSWNEETVKLRELAETLGLGASVKFPGQLDGTKLESAYKDCDYAYGTLAPQRKGAASLSTLKVRECLARGIPVVNAGSDPVHDIAGDFVFKLDSSDAAVDIAAVEAWAAGMAARPGAALAMRSLAERLFPWRKTMARVISDMHSRAPGSKSGHETRGAS